jgi:hypothetical protein
MAAKAKKGEENPFAAPTDDASAEEHELTENGISMPTTVKIVIGIMCVSLLLNLVSQYWFGAFLATLLIFGVIKRSGLAWQWAAQLGAVGAVIGVLVTFFFISKVAQMPSGQIGEEGIDLKTIAMIDAAALALSTGAWVTIVVLLHMPSSKDYFGLRCHRCRRFSSQAEDFFFKKVKCKSCGISFDRTRRRGRRE